MGSHLVDALIKRGHYVRVLDNLHPQVHGDRESPPEYLNKEAEFIKGDVRDRDIVKKCLQGMDILFHLAAAVGVGQSMYEIQRYVDFNSNGAAVLLDVIVNEPSIKLEKMIVASSMSIYGEGKYLCDTCGKVEPKLRTAEQLKARLWEMLCPNCNSIVKPIPTDEEKTLFPTSIYAITKRDHEEMFLAVGRSYDIPAVALRYFNIYGPRQALSNPYTGVAAIFSSRILNRQSPIIYEDGKQSRDFIHVADITQANLLAMTKEEANYKVFNVGTGRNISILEVSNILIKTLCGEASKLKPIVSDQFREGDIRHCFADISKIKKELGFIPKIKFEDGIYDLTEWVRRQKAVDAFEKAAQELKKRGLTK